MPWQLLYTSAPRLLQVGQTGFGVVARHRQIPDRVVLSAERCSQFARLPGLDADRVVFSHRWVETAGSRYHILTRIASAGADYTGRSNHLAHHLILTAAEADDLAAEGISAGALVLRFPWKTFWNETARWLNENDTPDLTMLPPSPLEDRSVWADVTGDPCHARLLFLEASARSGCIVIAPSSLEIRELFAESLRVVPALGWQFTFHTELDPGEAIGDFAWLGFRPGSPALAAARLGRHFVLDLTRPESLPDLAPIPGLTIPEEYLRTDTQPVPADPDDLPLHGIFAATPPVVPSAGEAFLEPPRTIPPPDLNPPRSASSPPLSLRPARVARAHSSTPFSPKRPHVSQRAVSLWIALLLAILAYSWKSRRDSASFEGAQDLSSSLETPETLMPSDEKPAPQYHSAPTRLLPAPASGSELTASFASTPHELRKPLVPLIAASALQLATLDLPQLRFNQVHLLITSSGEERGPLYESRNNLFLSQRDLAPILRLNYAAHNAVWSAGLDSPATPPVQWRILQDHTEILRVCIGEAGKATRPIFSIPLSARQEEDGTVGGEFRTMLERFEGQLWLGLPANVKLQLELCGYKEPSLVPLLHFRIDTGRIIAWIADQNAIALKTVPSSSAAAPGGSLSNDTEVTLQRFPRSEQLRLAQLVELRKTAIFHGSISPGAYSFFAGPANSKPSDAIWICDVQFAVHQGEPASN